MGLQTSLHAKWSLNSSGDDAILSEEKVKVMDFKELKKTHWDITHALQFQSP